MDRSALRNASAHLLVSPEVLRADGVLTIEEAVEHHLRRVLRLRDGDVVSATDGAGGWRLARVVAGPAMSIEPTTDVRVELARSSPISIATAIPKGDRFDWLVQKVTELGVDRLVLLDADRAVVRWKPDRTARQLERARRIADEALRQSRRVWRLQIDGPFAAADVLAEYAVAEPGGRPIVVGDVSVAIGPEGGWSDAELAVAADRVDLGATILRTETAAIAASVRCLANAD